MYKKIIHTNLFKYQIRWNTVDNQLTRIFESELGLSFISMTFDLYPCVSLLFNHAQERN